MNDQRREQRIEPPTTASIYFLGNQEAANQDSPEAVGYISNISRHGLQVTTSATNAPMASKQPLRVRVKVGKDQYFDMLGEVRWNQWHGYSNELGLMLFESRGTDYLLWQNHVSRALPRDLKQDIA